MDAQRRECTATVQGGSPDDFDPVRCELNDRSVVAVGVPEGPVPVPLAILGKPQRLAARNPDHRATFRMLVGSAPSRTAGLACSQTVVINSAS